MKKDEPIDRLLERALRPRAGARPQGGCLDPETIAAWTDGTLTGAERVAAEAHAADCDRCLAVLAAVARTTPPPSVAERPSWFSIRFLVPLTTAAIAITAWVVVQNPDAPAPASAPATQQVDAVKAVPPATPAPAPEREARAQARAESAPKRELARPSAGTATTQTANEVAKQVTPKSAPVDPPPPAAAAPRQGRFAALDAMSQSMTVTTPDANVRWRFSGTSVERSVDGGTTWRPQTIGATTQLLAGSAPDPRICWLVGRSGAVLLTTDGETWRRLEFPDATRDLVAVAARSASAATVTTSTGMIYETSDGGKTWRMQENAAAPF